MGCFAQRNSGELRRSSPRTSSPRGAGAAVYAREGCGGGHHRAHRRAGGGRGSAKHQAKSCRRLHMTGLDVIAQLRPGLLGGRPDRRGEGELTVEPFGFGGPRRDDLQESTVTSADVVLPIVERRPPTGTLEGAAVSRFEDQAVPAGTTRRLANAHRHCVIMNDQPCGSSVPTSCDFAGDSRSLLVGNRSPPCRSRVTAVHQTTTQSATSSFWQMASRLQWLVGSPQRPHSEAELRPRSNRWRPETAMARPMKSAAVTTAAPRTIPTGRSSIAPRSVTLV